LTESILNPDELAEALWQLDLDGSPEAVVNTLAA
jgi:hypothetical protein